MPMKSDREYRDLVRNLEVRTAQDGEENKAEYIVEGYATTFEEPYLLYKWGNYEVWEKIDRHAFDNCDMSDVIMQYDHEGRVFARLSNKTLELTPDDHGLFTVADLGGTEIGRQLFEEIKGGYTNKMSFGFTVGKDERTEEEDYENNKYKITRTIKEITKLYDVSAVSLPANDGTQISSRNFSEGVIAEIEQELQKRQEINLRKRKMLLKEQFSERN